MKPLSRRIVAWTLAALAATCAAQEPPTPIGATTVILPTPAGFVAVLTASADLRSLAETMTAASNRLLEFFVGEQDSAATRARRQPQLSRYFMAQTLRQTEERSLEARDFEKIKGLLRTQAQELAHKEAASVQAQISSAAKTIGDRAGVADMSMRVGELRMGEIFDETPASISLLAMTKYSVTARGKQLEVPVTMSMTTMLLHGKIVYFYAYSVFKSPADTEWVRAQTKAWVPRALAANR